MTALEVFQALGSEQLVPGTTYYRVLKSPGRGFFPTLKGDNEKFCFHASQFGFRATRVGSFLTLEGFAI